jgi:hypothetical protein
MYIIFVNMTRQYWYFAVLVNHLVNPLAILESNDWLKHDILLKKKILTEVVPLHTQLKDGLKYNGSRFSRKLDWKQVYQL